MACRRWRAEWESAAAVVRVATLAALPRAGGACEVSVVLTDDRRMRRLNRDYRGVDRPTNVLAFPQYDPGIGDAASLLGDVVLAYETICREAREQGKTADAHLAHLVVHGVLHLLGHDHATAREARRMEASEVAILGALGIDNPYRARLA